MDNTQFDAWLHKPIPTMASSQLAKFSDLNSIHAQEMGTYSPAKLQDKIKQSAHARVIGLDLGGGSVRGGVYEVTSDGSLDLTDDFSETTAAENGEGFLEQLEKYAEYVRSPKQLESRSFLRWTSGWNAANLPSENTETDGCSER